LRSTGSTIERINPQLQKQKIAPVVKETPDKVRYTESEIFSYQQLALNKFKQGADFDSLITELRVGGMDLDIAGKIALVGLIAYMIHVNGLDVEAFKATPLPHQDPWGWFTGKYDTPKYSPARSSHQRFRFERDVQLEATKMCAATADENGFVMSREQVIEIINENYGGSMQITEKFKITDQQAASHLYHGNGVGMKPEDFGITQEQLEKISDAVLIAYIRQGEKLPSKEHVRSY
jgi:hypothetical protein